MAYKKSYGKHQKKTKRNTLASKRHISGRVVSKSGVFAMQLANKTIKKKRNVKGDTQGPVVVGVVHAKWCGHCQNLMNSLEDGTKSVWERTKEVLSNKAEFVEIEHSVMEQKLKEMNDKYNVNLSVQGFPTIFKIKNGNLHTDYTGERTPESLAKWVYAK